MAQTIDPHEFEALYRTVAPELFGYLKRRGVNDAEDMVADVFATAWRRRADLPAPLLLRAWLFGTARRVLFASSRRAQEDHRTVTHLARHPTGVPADDPMAEQIVLTALSRLSNDDRELIQLVEWERLTPAEVAVMMRMRPGTVRVRLHRARKALASDPAMQALASLSSTATQAVG